MRVRRRNLHIYSQVLPLARGAGCGFRDARFGMRVAGSEWRDAGCDVRIRGSRSCGTVKRCRDSLAKKNNRVLHPHLVSRIPHLFAGQLRTSVGRACRAAFVSRVLDLSLLIRRSCGASDKTVRRNWDRSLAVPCFGRRGKAQRTCSKSSVDVP